jgi:polysaccharide biosynthesis/export protein
MGGIPWRPLARRLTAVAAVSGCALALLAGCASVGQYTWVDELPDAGAPPVGQYVIAPGDVIQVRVYNQEGMSVRTRVRTDGKISLPFLYDVDAAGYTPTALAQQLQTRLKEFVNLPVVTVSLDEPRASSVSVLGEVSHPGTFIIDGSTGVLQALALAGGLTDYARRDRIFVVRSTPSPLRIRFTFQKLAQIEGRAPRFRLQPGDVVVVE